MQEKIYFFLSKTLKKFIAISIIFFSIITALSLFSYNPIDNSFNVINETDNITNIMGVFGAYYSDLLLKLIGYSSYIITIITFIFGIKLLKHNNINLLWLKFLILPFLLIVTAIFLSSIQNDNSQLPYYYGGINGHYLLNNIHLPKIAISLITLIISLALFSITAGININDWRYFFRYSFVIIKYLFNSIENLIIFFFKKITPKKIFAKLSRQFDQDKINNKSIKINKPKTFSKTAKKNCQN